MRVRVLKDFSTATGAYHVGQIVEVSPRKAEAWMRIGLVMQDKSLDGAKETKRKILSPPKPRPGRGSRRR